jgi:hypothetical protein
MSRNQSTIFKTFPYKNYKELEITFSVNIFQTVSARFELFLVALTLTGELSWAVFESNFIVGFGFHAQNVV